MSTIGAFEAKTHFSELLARVAKGESFTITKHGESIAKLIPIEIENKKLNLAIHAANAIRELRKKTTLGKKLTIKKLITEGRKR